MRIVTSEVISQVIENLCKESNYYLSKDILEAIDERANNENSEIGKEILHKIKENIKIAAEKEMPICQDTGMTVVFIEIGNEVIIKGKSLEDAINEGVRNGYSKGYLRKSIVADPLKRLNTKDNTPAVIHYNIVTGDKIKITVAPKGFGSENMSALRMLKPSEGIEGVEKFIINTVSEAGPNPCPPIIVGVGIGGTFEKAAILSKKALLRPIDKSNEDPFYKELEDELLTKINMLGIGPQGFGGNTTALGVNIETYPTHIAGLPVDRKSVV